VKVSYTYPATVLDVIDGDTLHLDLELGRARHRNHDYGFHLYAEGFALRLHLTGRLLGLNAAEHGTPGGDAATANLTALLPPGTACQVITSPSLVDKYGGRWDVRLLVGSPSYDLGDWLVAQGWAAAWDGTGPKPVPPWPRAQV